MSIATLDRYRDSEGFTLIELLIVVVIIGILAAIAIPQFASTKESAFNAAAKSDLRNSMAALEAYYTQNLQYPNAAGTDDAVPNFTASENVTFSYNVTGSTPQGYTLSAQSQATGANLFNVCGGSLGDGNIQGPSSSLPGC